MNLDPSKFSKPRGVYDQTERATQSVRLDRPTAIESRNLGSQTDEFLFFVPYVPLLVAPGLPDIAKEYATAKNVDIRLVYWELDYQLVPSFAKRGIRTDRVFGLDRKTGLDLINFSLGCVLQDQKTGTLAKINCSLASIIEPTISSSKPAEKLLANQLQIYCMGVQFPAERYDLQVCKNRKELQLVRTDNQDFELWQMMNRFWRGETPI